MDKILFRVDGGKVEGLSMGHVYRTLALARELDHHGFCSIFLMRDIPEGVQVVKNSGYTVQHIPINSSPTAQALAMIQSDAVAMIIDIPEIDHCDIHRARQSEKPIILIDDQGGLSLDADMVVNGNLVKESHSYSGNIAKRLIGPKFCILGSEFKHPHRLKKKHSAPQILVTFGGSDPSGLTRKALAVLAKNSIDADFIVVLGPAFGSEDEIKRAVAESNSQFTILKSVESLATLMLSADIAIAAAGRSAYELAATGTPAILIPSIKHEQPVALNFAAHGSANVIFPDQIDALPTILSQLLNDNTTLENMSQLGQQLIDGLGCHRVASEIARFIKDNAPIKKQAAAHC